MRHFETGIGKVLDGVFVSCPSMRDALSIVVPKEKIHACGHVWSTEEVLSRMPIWWQEACKRSNSPMRKDAIRLKQVVYSSRWDTEKNPDFLLRVLDRVVAADPEVKFVVCTSSPKMRSNDPKLLEMLADYRQKYPKNLWVAEGLSKEEYYRFLCDSKVQFNCSNQDWVSYVLLEGSAAGCYPLYPRFRSFPETLLYKDEFMYAHLDEKDAADKILKVVNTRDEEIWSMFRVKERSWIHTRFDTTWLRMLRVMGVPAPATNGVEEEEAGKDPFAP